jgi:L-threonylcarbamoyladenylate synthase
MVLDGGACKGIESTIIGFENEDAVLYRVGSISIEDIERVIGKLKLKRKRAKCTRNVIKALCTDDYFFK